MRRNSRFLISFPKSSDRFRKSQIASCRVSPTSLPVTAACSRSASDAISHALRSPLIPSATVLGQIFRHYQTKIGLDGAKKRRSMVLSSWTLNSSPRCTRRGGGDMRIGSFDFQGLGRRLVLGESCRRALGTFPLSAFPQL